MKSRSYLLLVLISGLLFVWLGCGGPSVLTHETAPGYNKTVASFEPDYRLTGREFFDKLFWTGIHPSGGLIPDSALRVFRDSVVLDTLMSLRAHTMDLRDRFDHFNIARSAYYDSIKEVLWRQQIEATISVDSNEVRAYWEENPDKFHMRKQILFSHFLSAPAGFWLGPDSVYYKEHREEARQWAFERAFMVLQMLKAGAPFDRLCRIYSHDVTSRDQGGLVGWAGFGVFEDPFDSVVLNLEVGEFSEPYRTRDLWHIVFLNDFQPAGPMPLDWPNAFSRVESTLKDELRTERLKAFRDSIEPYVTLQVFDSLLSVPTDSLSAFTPLAVVGGRDTLYAGQFAGFERTEMSRPDQTFSLEQIRLGMIKASADHLELVSAARDLGIDTLPEVRAARDYHWFRQAKISLENEARPKVQVSPNPDDLRVYYTEHIERYAPSRPYTVEHLELKDSALAEFLLQQARTGLGLEDLRQEWGKNQGYDITYQPPRKFSQDEVPAAYWQMAVVTPADQFRVAKVDSSYFLMKMVERVESRTLEMIRGRVVEDMRLDSISKVFGAYRDSAFAEHNVKLSEQLPDVRLEPLLERMDHRAQIMGYGQQGGD